MEGQMAYLILLGCLIGGYGWGKHLENVPVINAPIWNSPVMQKPKIKISCGGKLSMHTEINGIPLCGNEWHNK